MARPRRIDEKLVERAREAASRATNIRELRAAQAVLLPAQTGSTLTETAALMGVGRATVVRLQGIFRNNQSNRSDDVSPQWGGRRHQLMSIEEEKEFLAPWLAQAKNGSMLVVSPIRAALAQKLGRSVSASVIYRLLNRHGWRKVAPDTRHPHSDPQEQDEWKKNCPKNSLPC